MDPKTPPLLHLARALFVILLVGAMIVLAIDQGLVTWSRENPLISAVLFFVAVVVPAAFLFRGIDDTTVNDLLDD